LADKFSALSPAQQQTILTILGIVAAVGPLLILIGKVTTGIGAIAVGASKLIGGIKLLGGGIAKLFSLVAANPIILIVAAIAAVVAIVIHLWQTNEGFRNAVISIWTAIVGFFSTVGTAIAGFFVGAWNVIKTVWSTVTGFFSGVWQGIVAVFSAVGSWFASVFGAAWNGIKNVWSAVTGFFSGVWNGITKVFSVVGGWFSSTFGAAWTGIKNIWSAVTGWFTGIWNGIKGVFKPNMISDAFGRAWGAIKDAWGGVAGWFRGVWNGISSGFRGAANAIIKAINWLIRGLNRIHFNIPDWVPGIGGKGFGIHIGEIPLLAKGGVIDKATLAMLGEQGKEAVLPLERNTGWIKDLARALTASMGGFSQPAAVPTAPAQKIVLESHINMDGRELALAASPYFIKQLGFDNG
jgi:phage-related protein